MMIDLSKHTDPYERKARLYPALLCIFPIIISISISFPSIFTTLSGFVALAAAFGLLQFISHLARDRGKALENGLFNLWGGMPSVVVLRHSDSLIPSPAKIKYHSVLSKKSGIKAPSREIEKKYPQQADAVYLSWSDFLRGKTRDPKKYPLVFKENVNYGFRRNLLGLKWYCVLSGAVGLVILNMPILNGNELSETMIAISLLFLLYMHVFIFVVNNSWVEVVAKAYGKQLIEAINA